jgi:hypothetical protein
VHELAPRQDARGRRDDESGRTGSHSSTLSHNAVCIVVDEDHDYFMLLTREFFQTFTDLPIGDPSTHAADLRRVSGGLAPDRAISTGVVEVLRGPENLLERFATTFRLAA